MLFLGLFLTDPLAVPWSVVEYVAVQLDVPDPSVIKRYTEREKTAYEHAWEIRDGYGYRDFADPAAQEQLRDFMDGRAWTHAEGALALFTPVDGVAAPASGVAAWGEHAGPAGVAGA